MGKIVILLSLVYEKECNNQGSMSSNTPSQKKIRLIMIGLLTMMMLSVSVFIYTCFKESINVLFWGSIILYVISMIGLIKYSNKQLIENCQDDKNTYYVKLNLLKNKMRTDFHIYSKNKILRLIDECDNVIVDINSRYKIIKELKEVWKGILAPIVGFVSALIVSVDNLSQSLDWTTLILALIIIALIILLVFGVLWGIECFSNMICKEEKRRIVQLKVALNDIYLKNFI